jgi:hypothetical protein
MVELIQVGVLWSGLPVHSPAESSHAREASFGWSYGSYLDAIDGFIAYAANNLRHPVSFRHL